MTRGYKAVLIIGSLALGACNLTKKQSPDEQNETRDPVIVDVTPPDIDDNEELSVGTDIGNLAPEIELNSPSGKTLRLSDLRGKMVLIDFWAAWCGPCRKENPSLVQLYDKYQNAEFKSAEGFEIFSVSLDRKQSDWESAIKADDLKWKYHVSDLKFWNSKAALEYGIRSIPYNILIDENGVIVAKNLRGIALHKAIDQYVEKL